jgi:hypothetical protein
LLTSFAFRFRLVRRCREFGLLVGGPDLRVWRIACIFSSRMRDKEEI